MGDASWTPIFVTADVPIEVTNSVLEAATTEIFQVGIGSNELVGNIWVLIQRRDQQPFSKPTNAPVATFGSDFIGATPEELQEFIQSRFGEDGVGKGSASYLDYLSDNAFAIIDERTARDKTVQFWVRELVDGIQESAIRVAWNRGSEIDEALARFIMDEESDEDLIAPARNAASDGQIVDDDDKEGLKQQVEDWMTREEENSENKWFEFKLDLTTAVQCTYGIYQRGVVDLLTEREEFDENGVYR
ncbi:hypothetical protein G7Z17_g6493 [Cylindrodendrum hubeiense]|uniref:Uncharacterized protein n=1 Tax=Cylindrodendrum hubeiense TaxID=595255 RepID=A0A9P5LG94_9HYPO|nr:hypothetical protein G7Z17_g6493 [Cylindrodendrum hubeiense]